MCGIFGFVNTGKKIELTQLMKELAKASAIRGTDATGIAYNLDDRKLEIDKSPVPASKFTFKLPKVRSAIGHTRAVTQGDKSKNYNNHPFRGITKARRPFALTHNGTIWNDKELQVNLPITHVETDSYVAVQLLERHKKISFATLRAMGEMLEGMFTFAILDNKNTVWFVKQDNPLYIVELEGGLFVYASTLPILMTALAEWDKTSITRIKRVIEPEYGDIMRLDVAGNITTQKFEPIPYSYNYSWYDYYKNGYTSYGESEAERMEELYLFANYLGISKDEIDSMISLGYTIDELEGYLDSGEIFIEMEMMDDAIYTGGKK